MRAYEHPELVALDEIEDILEAYAESRLSPTRPVFSRLRAAVLLEAAAVAATRAPETRRTAPVKVPAPPGRFSLPRLTPAHLARPAFALGFAGILAFGTGAAVSAAPPGSPFYNARVALQGIFLPVEIDARLASHEQHLEERLAEAEAAAARGDVAALAAALASFQAQLDEAVADLGDDFDRLSHFQTVLEKHVAKLTALSLRLPTEAARDNAVEHALQASQKAVTKVREQKERSNSRPTAPPRPDRNPPNPPDPVNPPNLPDRP